MTTKEIAEALRLHKLWHAGDKNGQRADLNGAYLIGADLREADLSRANLIGADLSRGNLIEANLSKADLNGAYLSGADLSSANLNGANLIGADLREADLSGTDLSKANLSRAYLIGADLREADLSGTDLRGADLSGADCSDSHTIPDDGTTRIIQIDGVSRRGYRVITAVHDDAIDWVWAGCASMPAAELLAAVEAKYGVEDADRFRDAFEFAIRMRKGERW